MKKYLEILLNFLQLTFSIYLIKKINNLKNKTDLTTLLISEKEESVTSIETINKKIYSNRKEKNNYMNKFITICISKNLSFFLILINFSDIFILDLEILYSFFWLIFFYSIFNLIFEIILQKKSGSKKNYFISVGILSVVLFFIVIFFNKELNFLWDFYLYLFITTVLGSFCLVLFYSSILFVKENNILFGDHFKSKFHVFLKDFLFFVY